MALTDEKTRHSAERSTAASEDYLKAIWLLGESSKSPSIAPGAIAKQLGVSGASVTGMVARLERSGHVIRRGTGIELTADGRQLAIEMVRHHRLLESFLVSTLGMHWSDVHAEAEVLEHHISERLEDLIDAHLGHPEWDPHGHPIPRRDGSIPDRRLESLQQLPEGIEVVIRQVRDESPEVLKFLEANLLTIGARIAIVNKDTVAGTLTVKVLQSNNSELVIGARLASVIDAEEAA